MTSHQRYMQHRKDELYHYNHNHDRRTGRFTSAKGVRAAISKIIDKHKYHMAHKDDDYWESEDRVSNAESSKYGHPMDQRFTPDPFKTRVVPPGERGSVYEYMTEYVPDRGLFESEEQYNRRINKIEDELYQQYIDTTSITDKTKKKDVEDRIFKEAASADPTVHKEDDVHNFAVAAALDKRIHKMSVDMYDDKAKSDKMKPIMRELEELYQAKPSPGDKDYLLWSKSSQSTEWKKRRHQLMQKAARQALADCGYEYSEAGENFILDMWYNL